MTIEELEKMGFVPETAAYYNPNTFWNNFVQYHFEISPDCTIEDLVRMLFESGEEVGIEEGKSIRSKEIRDLLM